MPQVEIFQWDIGKLQSWMLNQWESAGNFIAFTAVASAVQDLDNALAEWSNALPDSIKKPIWASYLPDYTAHIGRLVNILMVANASLATGLPFDNPLNTALAFDPMFRGIHPDFDSDEFYFDTNDGRYYLAPHVLEAVGLNPDDPENPFTSMSWSPEDWGRAQHGFAEWVYAFSLSNRAAMVGASPDNWLIAFGEFLYTAFQTAKDWVPEGMAAGIQDTMDSWSGAVNDAVNATGAALGNFGHWVAEKLKGGVMLALAAGAVVLGIVLVSRR